MRNSAEGYEEEEPYQVEERKYMNEQRSYHFKPNPNLPTHYTPALRNHKSFLYGGRHNRALDMDRTTIRFILNLGSNSSNNNNSSNNSSSNSSNNKINVAPLSQPDPFGGFEPSPGCSNLTQSPYQNHLSKTSRSVTLQLA